MGRKGISPVIASIILILIVISLSSAYVVFTGRLAGGQTEAAERQSQQLRETATTLFHIEDVRVNKVIVFNDGLETIDGDSFSISADDAPLTYTSSDIAPNQRGELVVTNVWEAGPGDHRLTVRSGSAADTLPIEIEFPEDLVLHLTFDEGSGTVVRDHSGNGNDGILRNGPTWTTSTPDGSPSALDFDGVDDFVEIAHSDSLNFSTGLTTSMRINPREIDTYNWVIDKSSSSQPAFNIYLQSPSYVLYAISPTSLTYYDNLVVGTINTSRWTQMITLFDSSRPSEQASVYLDGIRAGTNDIAGDIDPSTSPIGIGRRVSSGAGAEVFNGTIDEVRLYNSSITVDEMLIPADELYVMRRR